MITVGHQLAQKIRQTLDSMRNGCCYMHTRERPVSDTLFGSFLVSAYLLGTHLTGDSIAMTASDNVEPRADLKT